MQLRNNPSGYGWISILLHWIMTVLIIGLFALGKYMVDLDYYDPWYQKAPALHQSLGMVIALLLLCRLIWRLSNPHPQPIGQPWEQRAAIWLHRLFYFLIAAIVASGFLTATADGQALPVFDRFQIPALYSGHTKQAEQAGAVHEWLANLLIALALVHALAALKHHFFDRNPVLRRMLSPSGTVPSFPSTTRPEE